MVIYVTIPLCNLLIIIDRDKLTIRYDVGMVFCLTALKYLIARMLPCSANLKYMYTSSSLPMLNRKPSLKAWVRPGEALVKKVEPLLK